MLDNLKSFLDYRKQNKIISKSLGIKRDRKVEIFLLLGLWKSKKFLKNLKRNCRCYLEYYEERELDLRFEDLNYIVTRVAAIYNIIKNDEILEAEFENIKNCFARSYLEDKVKRFIHRKSDIENENLVVGAII